MLWKGVVLFYYSLTSNVDILSLVGGIGYVGKDLGSIV
jgi:hypothetical protein